MESSARTHWRLEQDADNIAWLHFDQVDSATNVLGRETLTELQIILSELAPAKPSALVFLSDKAGGFIAGADVKAFSSLTDREQALDSIRLGQSIIDQIEALPFPTVALIHGHCLGGGLELALACRYRVAEEHASLGLPEVMLGIHPGFGGTMRLNRLIGAPKAMDMMLSGRSVRGRVAKTYGIVDHAVPQRHLVHAARALASNRAAPHRPGFLARLASAGPARPLLAEFLRRKVAEKADPAHYPAPYALIDIWTKHARDDQRMLRAEAESVADLITGSTARNLVRLFFLRERLKALGKHAAQPARHLHVVGAGVMGGDIAIWCAMRGMDVTLQDTRREAIAQTLERAGKLYKRRLREPRRVQAALERIVPDEHGRGVSAADIVIEAIVEKVDAKQGLFSQLERSARPDALLATNTSSIPLETIAEALENKERLVGLHFFNPVAKMLLVEIVAGKQSSTEALGRAAAFAAHIDRLPLPVNSAPGFLVNRALTPYLLEAVTLEGEGVPISTIDRAATGFGMPMGPVELADTVGLDICLSVAEVLADALGVSVPERLREKVAAGHLGRKTGRGFYDYAGKKPKAPGDGEHDTTELSNIQDRLVLRLLNECAACLREGVIDDIDLLDAGMVFGTGFAPFRGGPMNYARDGGIDRIVSRMQALAQKHGPRFAPDDYWRQLGNETKADAKKSA